MATDSATEYRDMIEDAASALKTQPTSDAPSMGTTISDKEFGEWTVPLAGYGPGAVSGIKPPTAVMRGHMYDSNGIEYLVYFDKNGNSIYKEPTGRSKTQANASEAINKNSGGSGGSGSSAPTMSTSDKELFYDWMGRYPTAAETSKIASEGWTEDTLRRYAIKNGGDGRIMQQAKDSLRRLAAPFYDNDPSAVPESLVNSLISSGDYANEDYLVNTYFPTLKGVGATNPLAAGYVDAWHDLVGSDRPLTNAAITKMNELIKVFGFNDVGLTAFSDWTKTTEAAYMGAYGAEQRANIGDVFTNLLGRNPSAAELSQNSIYWGMDANQLEEAIMQLPEAKAIYQFKPAWEQPLDYLARLRGIDATFKWYYGDHFEPGPNGTLTYKGTAPPPASSGAPGIPAYSPAAAGSTLAAPPTGTGTTAAVWKSLTNAQFAIDLQTYGITVNGGKYYQGAAELSLDQLDQLLPDDTYYRDDKGFHYVQDEGAVDKYGNTALITKKAVML